MKLLLLASAGGAIGAALRYLVNIAFAARGLTVFPWATLTVNVVGSFLMGLAMQIMFERTQDSPELRTFLTTGILGGFTTFSAFSYEAVQLAGGADQWLGGKALAYVAASVILAVAALLAGMGVARAWGP